MQTTNRSRRILIFNSRLCVMAAVLSLLGTSACNSKPPAPATAPARQPVDNAAAGPATSKDEPTLAPQQAASTEREPTVTREQIDASTLPEQVDPHDWAFIPMRAKLNHFAYVDPRARLTKDERGLRVQIDPPLYWMELIYRKQIVGDFTMRLRIHIPAQLAGGPFGPGPESFPFIAGEQPLYPVCSANFRTFGPQAVSMPSKIPSIPTQDGTFHLTIERHDSQLCCSVGDRHVQMPIASNPRTGFISLQLLAPTDLWIEDVEFTGTTDAVAFRTPPLKPLSLEPSQWLTSASNHRRGRQPGLVFPPDPSQWLASDSNPQRDNVDDLRLTSSDSGLDVDNQVRGGQAAVTYLKQIDGDFYARAHIQMSVPLPIGANSIRQTATTLTFRKKKYPGFEVRQLVTLPRGSEDQWVTIARHGNMLETYSSGGAVFFKERAGAGSIGFDFNQTDLQIRIAEFLLFAETLIEPPPPEPVFISADGWQLDPKRLADRPKLARQIRVVKDDDRVRIETLPDSYAMTVTRTLKHQGDFQAEFKINLPPKHAFSERKALPTVRVEVRPTTSPGPSSSAIIEPPMPGTTTEHVIRIQRESNRLTLGYRGEESVAGIKGDVRIDLKLSQGSQLWVANFRSNDGIAPVMTAASRAAEAAAYAAKHPVPKTVMLPAAADASTIAGGGRYLILRLPQLARLVAFDFREKKVTNSMPIDETSLFAGGAEHLIVVQPEAKLITRYDLHSFKLEQTVSLTTSDKPVAIALGMSSTGPLAMASKDESGAAALAFFDLATLQPIDLPFSGSEKPAWKWEVGSLLRASGNGLTVGYSGQPSFLVTIFDGRADVVRSNNLALVVPGPLGKIAYSDKGPSNSQLAPFYPSPRTLGWTNAPQAYGPFSLGVTYAPSSPRRIPPDVVVTLCIPEQEKPLARFPDLRITSGVIGHRDPIPLDQRLVLHAPSNLIAMLSATNDRVILKKIDLAELVAAACEQYCFVTSQPPVDAPYGSRYEYQMQTLASGKVKYELTAGPEGMRIDADGLVTWQVPEKVLPAEQYVIISVMDENDEVQFHNFPIRCVAVKTKM